MEMLIINIKHNFLPNIFVNMIFKHHVYRET